MVTVTAAVPTYLRGQGGTSAVRYPRTFAFSAVVPRLCVELYRMVLLCFLFSLQLSIPSMETAVHKVQLTGNHATHPAARLAALAVP